MRVTIASSLFIVTALAVAATAVDRTPTFTKDVAPIFYKSCVECHRDDVRADVAHVVRRRASVAALDQAARHRADDAAVGIGHAARHLPQRPPPDRSGNPDHRLVDWHYDNSSGNKYNPDPTKDVKWGDQTWEEMMIGFWGSVVAAPTISQ